jgi:cytochrome c peroxidase
VNNLLNIDLNNITQEQLDTILSKDGILKALKSNHKKNYEKILNKIDYEKEGMKTFIDKGCAACHNDIGLGGTMMPFDNSKYDFAKGDFTGNANGMVKTPTLRNIEETAPYFHNGNIWSLKTAVKQMDKIQLKNDMTDEEANKIVTFLKSLTGKKPAIKYPVLPVITENTPKPDMN